MLPFEGILALLDEMRAEAVAGLESPGTPTEFGFGALHGRIVTIAEIRQRFEALVSTDDDEI